MIQWALFLQWNQNLQQVASKRSQALKKSTGVFMIRAISTSANFMKKSIIYFTTQVLTQNFSSIGLSTSDTMMKKPLLQFNMSQQRNFMLASNQDSKFLKMSLSSLIRSLSLDIKTTWRNKLFAEWASSHYLTSPLAMDTEKAWPWTYITRSRKLKLITSNS